MVQQEVGIRLRFLNWDITAQPRRPQPDELARRYDRLAGRWQAKVQRLGFQQAYANLFTHLRSTQTLSLRDGMSVLDCGIGSGALSTAVCGAYADTRLYHFGCDISCRMLNVARTQLAPFAPQAQLQCGDVSALPYASARFDLVTCAHVLEHLAEPVAGLQEMVRVLKPGAPLVLIITRACEYTIWVRAQWGLAYPARPTVQQWLHDAGLTHITFYPLTGGFWCFRLSMAVVGWKQA